MWGMVGHVFCLGQMGVAGGGSGWRGRALRQAQGARVGWRGKVQIPAFAGMTEVRGRYGVRLRNGGFGFFDSATLRSE